MPVCDWPISYSSCATDGEGEPECMAGLDPDERALYEDAAIEFLSLWTGGAFGLCELTIRPCRTECEGSPLFWGRGPYPLGGGAYAPVNINGSWGEIICGQCFKRDSCSCGSVSRLKIPGPVFDIEEIVIGGEVLDQTAYRVDDWNVLIRQDGGAWPTCQDLGAPDDSLRAWTISYTRGRPVPAGGQIAAGILACEVKRGACKESSCALPERIKNITRQGVTVTLIDDFKDLDGGRTGIYLIDTWVSSVMKAPRRSTVMSPDFKMNRASMTTWRAPVGP